MSPLPNTTASSAKDDPTTLPPPPDTIVQVEAGAAASPSTSPTATTATADNQPITLSWENVSYSIPVDSKGEEKLILNDLSGYIEPGSVVAIMGASGAGKSTLLNVLAGRIGPGTLKGTILVNGVPRPPATWKQIIGYVEQDDLMFNNLTVRETLEYAALLRLPRSLNNEEKKRRVDDIISVLGLAKCEHTKIGSPDEKSISGGERKRVSIGIELVTQPRLIFLDEPTSGLDAFTASTIVESIKKLAVRDKRTVLMTIHQPREYILSMFDKLILLSGGKLVYTGPVSGATNHFEKCGFKCPGGTNPSDFFLDIMTIDFRSAELKEKSLARVGVLQNSWQQEPIPKIPESHAAALTATKRHWPNSFWYEFSVLLRRNFQDVMRDKATLGATLGQAVINTLILGFVFFQMDLTANAGVQNRIGALFFMCIQLTFGNVMPTIALFTLQRMIIRRERAAGTYRTSSAYLAKILSQLPVVLLATAIFAFPVYWMMGLQAVWQKYLTFVVILFVHATAATLMGIMISSGVPNVRVGQIIGPLIIVVFLIFSGQLVNLDSTPVVFRWIRWLSIIFYSYSALIQNEMYGLTFTSDPNVDLPCRAPTITGESVVKQFSLDALPSLWYNVLINACLALAFTIIGYGLFRWRSKPLMKLK